MASRMEQEAREAPTQQLRDYLAKLDERIPRTRGRDWKIDLVRQATIRAELKRRGIAPPRARAGVKPRKPSRHDATRAKTTKGRAAIAARYIVNHDKIGDNERGFYDCFEMGDGDDVVRLLVDRARIDDAFADCLRASGHGFWLEPGYLA